MSAETIIAECRQRGIELAPGDGGRLRYRPVDRVPPDLLALLAAHKRDVLAALADPPSDPAMDAPAGADWRDRLTPAERDRLPAGFDPPESYTAALLRVRDVFDGEIMDAAALVLGPFVETPTGYLAPAKLSTAWAEWYGERAAIREHDGGQAREHAEHAALVETLAAMRRAGAWPFCGPPRDGGRVGA